MALKVFSLVNPDVKYLSAFMCVYMYMSVCEYICIPVCKSVWSWVCVHVYLSACAYTHVTDLLFGGFNLRSIINSPSLILGIYFLFLIIYSNYKYFYGCLVLKMISGNQSPVPTTGLYSNCFCPSMTKISVWIIPLGGHIAVLCVVYASESSVLKSLLLNGYIILDRGSFILYFIKIHFHLQNRGHVTEKLAMNST